MYNADFSNSKAGRLGHTLVSIEEISFEDRKFLNMMDENFTKAGKHYQLPLSLKNESIISPDNQHFPEKRHYYLKKRFLRNHKLFTDYRKFIEVPLVKGYSRKSTKKATEGRTWYVPHHGVYRFNNPEKLIVAFNCRAKFNGVSLNKSLMSGPDLTNQIAGVITRFRGESVAIMGDIEAIFHLALVPGNNISLLRFLQ